MIEKKQNITKQFLLSFKRDHGQFYEKFVSILKGKVHYGRQVRQHVSCPNYMLAQKCIFMAIMERKHDKFENQQYDIEQLVDILKKYRSQITKSVSNQKMCVLNRIKSFKIQQMENMILEIVTREHFAFNSFNLEQNTYVYELIKAICGKSQEISFLGQQKYVPFTYTQNNIKQICSVFNQKIIFFDYNSSKNAPVDIQFNHETTYILRVKQKYVILYVKQPKQISIVTQQIIPLSQIQQLFTVSQPKTQQKGFFDRLLHPEQKTQNKNLSSKLFPDQVECSKCFQKFSQFDCLKWNYQNYCGSCLENPRLDTSSIPSTLIQKYFRERGIKHSDYQIQCAECTGLTHLRKYNPANKPQKYICQICEHKVCLEHNQSIYDCFCECSQCKQPTINVLHLNLAVCERCKKKFCRKCKSSSENFCNCVCKLCFELNEQNHICRERCHFCYNHINKMKICICGHKICYGCYYYKMRTNSKNGQILCNGPTNYA